MEQFGQLGGDLEHLGGVAQVHRGPRLAIAARLADGRQDFGRHPATEAVGQRAWGGRLAAAQDQGIEARFADEPGTGCAINENGIGSIYALRVHEPRQPLRYNPRV